MTFNNDIQSRKRSIDNVINEISGIPSKIKEAIPNGRKGIGNFISVSDFLRENINKYNIECVRNWFDGKFDSYKLEQKFRPHADVNEIDEYLEDIYYEVQNGVEYKELTKDEREIIKDINNFGYGLPGISTFKDLYNSVDLWLSYRNYDSVNDLLGLYTSNLDVRLFIDEIYKVAKNNEFFSEELDHDKFCLYLIGYVYIHELFHRYYDLFHEEAIKTTVPEIEEPMAELGALITIEEMVRQRQFDGSFFKVAYQQVFSKRRLRKYYHYSLGASLYDDGYGKELIEHYVRVSSLFDANDCNVMDYKNCLGKDKKDYEMLAKLIFDKKSNSKLQPMYNVKY